MFRHEYESKHPKNHANYSLSQITFVLGQMSMNAARKISVVLGQRNVLILWARLLARVTKDIKSTAGQKNACLQVKMSVMMVNLA